MTDAHELVLDIVRTRTNTDAGLPPVISRFDLTGRAALAGLSKTEASQAIGDLLRDDSIRGQQLVAMEHEPPDDWPGDDDETITWLCLKDQEQIQAANRWLLEPTEVVEA